MGVLTTRMTRYLLAPFRRTRARWQPLARSHAGYALWSAVTTLVLSITGGLDYLVTELRTTWKGLRLLSRDEAGYTTKIVIVVGLLVVIAFAAFVILWMTVISKAIHTRVTCHPGRPCG